MIPRWTPPSMSEVIEAWNEKRRLAFLFAEAKMALLFGLDWRTKK